LFLPTPVVGKIPFEVDTPESCQLNEAKCRLWVQFLPTYPWAKFPAKEILLPCFYRDDEPPKGFVGIFANRSVGTNLKAFQSLM